MATLKLTKTLWQRRRFIVSEPLNDLGLWMDVSSRLKERVLKESVFQLLGKKVLLEVGLESKTSRVLLEVVGIPQIGFETMDVSEREVFILKTEYSSFEVDFETLQKDARSVFRSVAYPLEEVYYIVLEGAKLELHFFGQKDYIQTTQ